MTENKSESSPPAAGPFGGRVSDYVRNTLMVGAIAWTFDQFKEKISPQPWQALWVMIPLGAVCALLYYLPKKNKLSSARLSGRKQVFLVCYLSIFCLAASSDILVWKREAMANSQTPGSMIIDADKAPRYWLAPARLGDWRYLLARRSTDKRVKLRIVTMPGITTPTQAMARRRNFARLINLAVKAKAQGIAFDYHFERDTAIPGDSDRWLGEAAMHAAEEKMLVLTGEQLFRDEQSLLVGKPYPASLDLQLPVQNRVHLQGWLDADRRARFIAGALSVNQKALSVRVVEAISEKNPPMVDVPDTQLLQFVDPPPDADINSKPIAFDTLWSDQAATLLKLNGYFILVGEDSKAETFATPFGDRLGVMLHAAAINSLLAGNLIRHPPWWTGMLVIVLSSYGIIVLTEAGTGKLILLGVTAGISVFLLASAAVAMALWQTWLDVIYAQVAIWLLLALLLVLRRPPPEKSNGTQWALRDHPGANPTTDLPATPVN